MALTLICTINNQILSQDMSPTRKFKILSLSKKTSELTIDILIKFELLENYVNQISVNKQTTVYY